MIPQISLPAGRRLSLPLRICRRILKSLRPNPDPTLFKSPHPDKQFSAPNMVKKKVDSMTASSSTEWDHFYKAFELNFRGSKNDVEDKISHRYTHHLENEKKDRLLDLGCGHGEMLTLAKKCGYQTLGIDMSSEAVKECRKLGHETLQGDILQSLAKLQDKSHGIVTLLHVIEHCPNHFVLKLFKEVFRVLKPGGLFLVETPSLYSLWAGHRQFYLDPTHIRPVHPEYIKFLSGYCGFKHCDIDSFGPVTHTERSHLILKESKQDSKTIPCQSELKKLEQWLYGNMDICCIIRK